MKFRVSTGCRLLGWWFAILLPATSLSTAALAQTPQLSLIEQPSAEAPPALPAAVPQLPLGAMPMPFVPLPLPLQMPAGESFHSTQCYFPPPSVLTPREPAKTSPPAPAREPANNSVVQASCSSCASGLGWNTPNPGLGGCCGSGGCCGAGRLPCYPGKKPFCGDYCDAPLVPPETTIGRFFFNLYECICCQDPCYEGKWCPVADTAFYAAAPRPITQQRLKWAAGLNVTLPDRSEFFWPRADGGAGAKGPKPAPAGVKVISHFNVNDINYYFEAAAGIMSISTEMSYRSMDLPPGAGHFAGFGDIKIGLKSLIFDCELIQVATQMITYTPAGAFTKGLGVGHVSLEPSMLVGIRLGPDTYFQHQMSEWIPLGGDPDYAGAVFHTHSAINHVLYRFRPDIPLIGTLEANTWSFQDGAYTDPVLGAYQGSSGTTYASIGPGFRLFVCDRIDFGFSASFALNDPHFWDAQYITEFRWRF